jgi:DUF4097 and DUF4098 domain-containing protein YvlB
MRTRDLVVLTAFTACGLALTTAPGRPQSRIQEPVKPAAPVAPVLTSVPTIAAVPVAPSFPAESGVLPAPPLPRSPAAPAVPSFPETPMEMNLSGSASRHDGPAADCGDLDIRFHDEPATIESEERTFSKADSRVLHIDELENGGVQLQGWDKDLYSVTACKAADASRGDAKQLISQIKLSVQGGHVSISGPASHNDWNVYLLIRTPRAADVEVKAHNGPLAFYRVDGKITARGTNGPITVADCTGEADIEAVNGPISFSGTGGKLRLHTQNGPISVALSGANWSGSSLVADAVNGPVSLSVPAGFQSAFLVESRGRSPISCHARVCDDARKTWDDEHRRIEYGSGTPVIRLSTENGPVSVNAP